MLHTSLGADIVKPLIIAIDGRSGSGKSTLALELASMLREHHKVSMFRLEDIYPGWNGLQAGVDRYVQNVLAPLAAGQDAHWLTWDWERHFDGESRCTPSAEVILVEGVGAAQSHAREFLDAIIWVQASDELRKERALGRDGDVYAAYWDRWAAQEETLLAADDPQPLADILVHSPQDSLTDCHNVITALSVLPACATELTPEAQTAAAAAVAAESLDATGVRPERLFTALFGDSQNGVWLDSSNTGEAPPSRSRFSIMADDAGPGSQVYSHRLGANQITIDNVQARFSGPFFRWLNAHWSAVADAEHSVHDLPYALGWLGYLGYELKRETGGSDQRSPLPDASLLFPSRALVLDHVANQLWLLGFGSVDPEWRAQVQAALRQAQSPGTEAAEAGSAAAESGPVARNISVRDDSESYKGKIARAQDEIIHGNSYEVCLTTALDLELTVDPLLAYSRLRTASPAPFAAFMRFGPLAVLSSSPERLLSLSRDGELMAEPIKGTRRRGRDPEQDAALKAELAGAEKDRAENVMIVDLMRNDLLKCALPESLRVTRLFDVETYATVFQLVSTVTAQLAPGASRAEAVAAAFPAGSMTGAPKISTMAILDELEAAPRGPYAGAAGYFSRDGAADLSVVIRTVVSNGGRASVGIGGAITTDSAPEEEWQEARVKALGVLRGLGIEFPG